MCCPCDGGLGFPPAVGVVSSLRDVTALHSCRGAAYNCRRSRQRVVAARGEGLREACLVFTAPQGVDLREWDGASERVCMSCRVCACVAPSSTAHAAWWAGGAGGCARWGSGGVCAVIVAPICRWFVMDTWPPTGGWTWHIAAGAANCVDAQPFDDVVAAATGELEEGGHHARASPRAASSPAGACSCLWVCSRASSFLLVRQVVVTFRCGCCVCGGGVVAACLCAADVECGSVTGSPQCALLASVLSDAVPLQSFDMEWPFDELFDVDFPLDLSHLAGPAAH